MSGKQDGPSTIAAYQVIAVAAAAVIAIGALWASPHWRSPPRSTVRSEAALAAQQAKSWIGSNLDASALIVTDPVMRAELVADGLRPDRVAPYEQLGGPLAPQLPTWRSYDYVVSTDVVRAAAPTSGAVAAALTGSWSLATFGDGAARVDLRQIAPDGVAAAQRTQVQAVTLGKQEGQQLLRNVRVLLQPAAAVSVVAGGTDLRLLTVLVALGSVHTLRVVELTDPGARPTQPDRPRRAVIDRIDGAAVAPGSPAAKAATAWLDAQSSSYRPSSVEVNQGSLVIEYRLPLPDQDLG